MVDGRKDQGTQENEHFGVDILPKATKPISLSNSVREHRGHFICQSGKDCASEVMTVLYQSRLMAGDAVIGLGSQIPVE